MKHCNSFSLSVSSPGGSDCCHSLPGLFFKFPLPGAIGNGPVWVPGANVQMGLSQCQPSKHKPECTARSPAGAGRMMERRLCDQEHISRGTCPGTQRQSASESSSPQPITSGCRNHLHSRTLRDRCRQTSKIDRHHARTSEPSEHP